MTREEAINELEHISEDTVQRCCATCGRLHIGTYSGVCALCSLCECVPEYARDYHYKYQKTPRWIWNKRWSSEALRMAIAALSEQEKLESNLKVLESKRWVSVEERLPDESMYGKEFIVAIKNRFNESHTATMHWWGENQQAKIWTVWHDVTHWMPLPEPPEEGDDGKR